MPSLLSALLVLGARRQERELAPRPNEVCLASRDPRIIPSPFRATLHIQIFNSTLAPMSCPEVFHMIPANRTISIPSVWVNPPPAYRCERTGNLVGTDVLPAGTQCSCATCCLVRDRLNGKQFVVPFNQPTPWISPVPISPTFPPYTPYVGDPPWQPQGPTCTLQGNQ